MHKRGRLYTTLSIMPKDMDDTNKDLLAQFSPQQQVQLVWYLQCGAQQHVLHTRPAGASGRINLQLQIRRSGF